MTQPIPYLLQGQNIVLVIEGQPHTISTEHLSYEKILDAVKAADWGVIPQLVSVKEAIKKFSQGAINIDGDQLTYNGFPMHGALADRTIKMLKEGFDLTPMVNFINNLMKNPSSRAVNELYGFLEKNSLPITEDGCFLAYKKIRRDYYDCHSGSVLNKPAALMTPEEEKQLLDTPENNKRGVNFGVIRSVNGPNKTYVQMVRNMVDEDKDRTCSAGLHFCSIDYLSHFGGDRIVTLKINPADVVAIPSDYNNAKGRCCYYIIESEMAVPAAKAFSRSVQNDAHESEDEYSDTVSDAWDYYDDEGW